MDKEIRKITKIGKKSYGIIIPIEIIRKLKWKERQKVIIGLKRRRITIRDWKK